MNYHNKWNYLYSFHSLKRVVKYIQSSMRIISVNSFLDYRDCLSLTGYAYSLKNNQPNLNSNLKIYGKKNPSSAVAFGHGAHIKGLAL